MASSPRRLGWPGWVFYTLLAITGSLIIWNWPQSPRWRMSVPNPENNRSKANLLFFSEDSQRVFFSESDKESAQASVAHYDARTGQLLERVDLWHDRKIDTGEFPPIFLTRMPSHNHRTLVAMSTRPNGGKDVEFYDVYQGQSSVAKLTGINQVYHSLSKAQRWAQYFAYDQKKLERPDLLIADAMSGEVVLQFKPECDSAGKVDMVYGWSVVFDPTERFVAIVWNSNEGFSPHDSPEKHQSQIRIHDLQTRQEVRRVVLPSGSSWSMNSWEANQIWMLRTRIEYREGVNDGNPLTYSWENRVDLDQDNPNPTEYLQFFNKQIPKNSGMELYIHRREANWLAFQCQKMGTSSWERAKFLQKLIEWFPSLKEIINEYFPEYGTRVWLADYETAKPLWECRRTFYGNHDISPDGKSLAITFVKKDAIEIEMWDTHYPRRWWWVLGYLGLLAAWVRWRSARNHATLTAKHA